MRLLNALDSEDRGLKVRFSLATIVFETFELILCQMLSSQGKNAPSNPYPHYLVRLAASRGLDSLIFQGGYGRQGSKLTIRNKNSPKRKFSGRISRGRPGVIRVDVLGQNFGQALEKD